MSVVPWRWPEPGEELMSALYETDFYSWTLEQARAVRAAGAARINTPAAIDWENLAEELEGMARSEADALYSRYLRLLQHLLKWRYQPDGRGGSWRGTIVEQRTRARRLILKNPGLKPQREELFHAAYEDAVPLAAAETELPSAIFPETSPFTLDQALDESFWPE